MFKQEFENIGDGADNEFQIAQRKKLKSWGRSTEGDRKREVHRQPYED